MENKKLPFSIPIERASMLSFIMCGIPYNGDFDWFPTVTTKSKMVYLAYSYTLSHTLYARSLSILTRTLHQKIIALSHTHGYKATHTRNSRTKNVLTK